MTSTPDLSQLAIDPVLKKLISDHIDGGGSVTIAGQGATPQTAVPPPPPPPVMNFHTFSTDPANAAAIQGALNTVPGQPTPFNHPPPPGPPSIFSMTPNPYPEPSQQPNSQPAASPSGFSPITNPYAAASQPNPRPAVSPRSIATNGNVMPSASSTQQQNPMPSGIGGIQAQGPSLPPVSAPQVNLAPPPTYDQWAAANPDKLAHQQAQTPLGRALFLAAAGLSGAAGGMHGDPSAGLKYVQGVGDYNNGVADTNQARYENGAVKPYLQALQASDTRSQNDQRAAEARLANAKALQVPANAAAGLTEHGLKAVTDENGQTSYVPDEQSPAYQKQQAQTEYIQAQQDLTDAQTKLAQFKADPNNPEYRLQQERINQASQRMSLAGQALGLRAQNLGLRKQVVQAGLYGTDLQGNDLPGATHIANDDGSQTTIGQKNAPTAIKQQKTVSTFKDLNGSVDNAEGALRSFFQEGGSLSGPRMVAAMNDPKSMTGKVVRGLIQSGMTQKQINAITAVRQLHEQAGILRSTTGGTGSEAQAQRILDTVPVAGDSNDMALSKIGEIRKVTARLAPGVSTVSGGLSLGKQPTPSSTGGGRPEGTRIRMPDGSTQVKRNGKWVPE